MIGQIDDAIFRAEKAAVAAILSVMGLIVFLDVVHRVSTRSESLLSSPVFIGVAGTIIGGLALMTRGRSPVGGIAIGIGIAAAQQAFIRVFPNGFFWSQALALALTLWLGLVGASLAAHERRHLALDIGSKLWPPAIAPKAVALGHVITAAFCVVVVWFAAVSALDHFNVWSESDHTAATLSGTVIPKWFAAAAIPYGMSMLTFRFLREAVGTWRGDIAIGGDDTLHQLGIEEKPS